MSRFVPTRWSHLLSYSGVGAVVRTDDDLFVIRDIRDWTDPNGQPGGEIIDRVQLLRQAMQIDRGDLRRPPLAKEGPNGIVDGVPVPAQRFPRWARCPRCGLLYWKPWRSDRQDDTDATSSEPPRCAHCKQAPPQLQQVGWVLAHQDGGLDDVPWHWLAHDRAERQLCREDRGHFPYLILFRDRQRGLRWMLRCGRCGAPPKPFEPGAKLPLFDSSRQPWQWGASPRRAGRPPGQVLEVSDPRLYFPRVRSGLVIPPESRTDPNSIVARLHSNQRHCDEIARRRRARGSILARLADEYGCRREDMEDAWRQIQEGYPNYGQVEPTSDLAAAEYRALCTALPELTDDEDFVPRHQSEDWRSLSDLAAAQSAPLIAAVDQLVALTRLREVRVFEGFSRVKQYAGDLLSPNADEPNDSDDRDRARLIPPDLDNSLDWLPALELYGEGIFFTLSEPMLQRWASQPALRKRARILQRRLEASPLRFTELRPEALSPRFILLHTLAHLLIRQLETQAGYPAASIRERIYCRDGDEPMAGILVYVAVPDLVGSLGGLAEVAEPRRFLRLLGGLFSHADWCATDPVCCEHEGQGLSLLNLAACHACTLVPEPSCVYGNALLDRVCVRGDLAGKVRPLLDFAVEAPGVADIQSALILAMLDSLVQTPSGTGVGEDAAADPRQAVLDRLALEADRLDSDKQRSALKRLSDDLEGILGIGASTVSELFEQHARPFSRAMLLFFLRDRSEDLLDFRHPRLQPMDLAVAALLFGAVDGWMGMPASLRAMSELRDAVAHRMAQLAQRLSDTGLALGAAPERPRSLREYFLIPSWDKAQQDAALLLIRGLDRQDLLKTRISLGKGDYRLLVDGRGAHLLLDGDVKAVTIDVDRDGLFAQLAEQAPADKLQRRVLSLLQQRGGARKV